VIRLACGEVLGKEEFQEMALQEPKETDMTAQEYIETRVSESHRGHAVILGLVDNGEGGESWWHVQKDEEIPEHVLVKISEDWE
jgi:hypothetical protein